MLQATNNLSAAASGQDLHTENIVWSGDRRSEQALLNGLVAWRTQGNLPGLVAQHRDVASRLIEQFVNDPHSLTLDLRGLQLQGLPAKFANLQPILQNRSSAAALAVFRVDHEAFASQAQRTAYHQHLGPHLQVAQQQASTASTSAAGPLAPSVPPGNPDQHRQWAGCVAAVVGAMREGALPLLDDIVKSLQTLAQREDSTLQIASNFFTNLQAKVNSNISKTNAKQTLVCALPQLDYRNPVAGQERMLNVLADLNRVHGVLQYAKASSFHSSGNVRKALERVGDLNCVALFIEKMFDCLYTLRRQAPKLTQDLLDLENILSGLHTRCMKAEARGQPTEHEIVQLTNQLIEHSEALRKAYMQVGELQQQLGGLAQVNLPDGLRGKLLLPQRFENWGIQNTQKMEALQLHENTSLLLGRLANPNLDLTSVTAGCKSLAGELGKLSENSAYWPLIEAHPRLEVRQLAAHRQQSAPVDKPLEAVHVPHTDLGLLTQKDAAFQAAAKGDLKALHQCFMKGLDPLVRNEQKQTLLHEAAQCGQIELISWLVKVQKLPIEDTDKDGHTPFLWAAFNGQALTMAKLRDLGASSTVKINFGDKAIHLATASENREALTYCNEILRQSLEESGAFGRTPLLAAAAHGNVDAMKWLAERGAILGVKDSYGYRAIHWAARSGNVAALEHCVKELNHKLEEKDALGRTPLLNAARKGKVETMKWLVQRGAVVNTEDELGSQAIHWAAESENLAALEYCLKDLKQNLEEKNLDGFTPLLCAAEQQRLQAIQWLINQGANIHAIDEYGRGLVDLAAENVKAYAQSLF